jgi:hypothetical protein
LNISSLCPEHNDGRLPGPSVIGGAFAHSAIIAVSMEHRDRSTMGGRQPLTK